MNTVGPNGKESACNAGDLGLIPGSGRSLEKGMATHASILAWRIPWTEEPGRLQAMESRSIGHYWVTNTSHFRNKWRPRLWPYGYYTQIHLTNKRKNSRRIQYNERWWWNSVLVKKRVSLVWVLTSTQSRNMWMSSLTFHLGDARAGVVLLRWVKTWFKLLIYKLFKTVLI